MKTQHLAEALRMLADNAHRCRKSTYWALQHVTDQACPKGLPKSKEVRRRAARRLRLYRRARTLLVAVAFLFSVAAFAVEPEPQVRRADPVIRAVAADLLILSKDLNKVILFVKIKDMLETTYSNDETRDICRALFEDVWSERIQQGEIFEVLEIKSIEDDFDMVLVKTLDGKVGWGFLNLIAKNSNRLP